MIGDRKRNSASESGAVTSVALENQRAGKTSRGWYQSGAPTENEMKFIGTGSLLRYGDRPELHTEKRRRPKKVSAMRSNTGALSHSGQPRADVGTRHRFAIGMQRRATPAG